MNAAHDKLDLKIDPVEQKSVVRREMLEKLRQLAPDERAVRSGEIVRAVRALTCWDNAGVVLAFHPLRSEPDVRALLASDGKRMLLPKVDGNRLRLYEYSGSDSLRRSEYGMLEPDPSACVEADTASVDLVVIPGLAFDRETGVRLGRGGGFYDRFLDSGELRARIVGVCFEFQLYPGLIAEAHDQVVDTVVVG